MNNRHNGLRKLYIALIMLFMYAPIFILMVLSFNTSKSRAKWGGFTLKWYSELFQNEDMMGALYTTILIALIASAVAVIVGVIASLVINNLKARPRRIIMGITNIPMLNADIVTGISLMIFFIVCRLTLGFTSVLIAHITFCIPYVILSVLPRLSGLDNSLIEAALDLGCTKRQAFFKILLPEIAPGIVSGFVLSFTMSFDDFIITHFTKGAGINTLSTKIYTELRKGIKPEMYALSTILFVIVLLLMILSQKSETNIKYNTGYNKFKKFVQLKVLPVIVVIAIIFCSVKVYGFTHSTNDNQVVVYNWGEYIDPDVITQFEEETGIDVIYEEYDSNETMYAKVKSGAVNYDVLCPSDYMISKMISEDMLAKIDYSVVTNSSNIGQTYIDKSQGFDPTNEYSIPYLWGTVGILYNKTMVNETVDSWDILWDENYSGEILMYDSVRDSMCVALGKAGYSINTTDLDELDEAKNLLIEQKPLVNGYVTDQCKDKMVGGEAALCVCYSGDAAEALRENSDLAYAIPKETTNMWIDSLVVPENAANKDNAMKFINFLCREDIAIQNFVYTGYSSPVECTKDALDSDDEILRYVIFPDDRELEHLEVYVDLGDKWNNKYSEIFKEVKSK